jgi:hypothetical protein
MVVSVRCRGRHATTQIGRMLAFVLTVVDHEPKADVKESAAEALPALALTVLAGVLKLRS